ncbi:MAG: hypothetical protein NT062_04465 [Proteobacteria bacterium]|nr:hypothetical protein [Pseudomonadota bacterium]
MRNLLKVASIASLLAFAACSDEPIEQTDPPVLKIITPTRATIQGAAGTVTVQGRVAPNDGTGAAIATVMVNGVPATLAADGSFLAVVTVGVGATHIHTVAKDVTGQEVSDTRAVLAGEMRAPGSNIEKAVAASLSADAFAKIAKAAGTIIKGVDVASMVTPMNPVQHAGDPDGEDCLFDRVYVDDLKFTDVKIALVPAQGGLNFSVEIDGLDVPGHARYAVSCISGEKTWRVQADKIIVSGQLSITPNGMAGFDTKMLNPDVNITNLQVDASGIPGTIIDMMNLNSTIEWVVEKGAEMAMNPIMNQALGGLGGPKQLAVMGKTIDMQVVPADIVFDPTGGLVTLDTSILIGGAEGSQGYVFTDNSTPAMDPAHGFQIGLADDLANEMMSQFNAIGMMNISQPTEGGSFDTTTMKMTLPPVISADPADGKLRVILGDVEATFTSNGAPVGRAAVNAKLDVKIVPAASGYGVAIELGKPDLDVDVVEDDIVNNTRFTNKDLARAVEVSMANQVETISKLLTSIPLPQVAGLQMKNMSMSSDAGYVMVKGTFE